MNKKKSHNKYPKNSYIRAIAWLRQQLSLGKYSYKLPSLRVLAKSACVRTQSMSKALHHLQKEGIVTIAGRAGIFVGNPPFFDSTHISLLEKIKRNIVHSIFTETFPISGATIAELQKQHGVCRSTMKKAISDLVEKGYLVRLKNRYIKLPKTFSHQATLLYVGLANERGRVHLSYERLRDIVVTLKKCCIESKIRLLMQSVSSFTSLDIISKKIGETLNIGVPLGTIVCTFGLNKNIVAKVVESASQIGKPVAIFDIEGETPFQSDFLSEHNSFMFSLAGSEAGRAMGRFFLGIGHKSICYISPFHQNKWSQQRAEGIRATFEEAGYLNGYSEITLMDNNSAFFTHNFIRPKIRRFVDDIMKRGKMLWPKNMVPTYFQPHIESIIIDAASMLHHENVHYALIPLLQKACTASATAWVTANDVLSISAIDFLEAKGFQVPKDVSVAGFDDSKFAYEYGITSYNFDLIGITKEMFAYILEPKNPLFNMKSRQKECRGFITERESTIPLV